MYPAKRLYLEKELFELPFDKNDSILYAPLKKAILLVNKNLINLLCDIDEGIPVDFHENRDFIDNLKRHGILHDSPESARGKAKKPLNYDKPFLPTNLTLFLTSECNLACRYCYGNGGDQIMKMPLKMGLDAVDLLYRNAARSGAKQVHLSFHGGGEPVLQIRTIKNLVEYARQLSKDRKVDLTLGLTTNAVMSENSARWLAQNMEFVNISFDGPEDIQNYQRPMRSGKNGFKRVVRTLKIFDAAKKKYSFRATISDISGHRIPEIVTFFTDTFHPMIVQIEPVFRSGRATQSNIGKPKDSDFVKGYMEAEKILRGKGIQLKFSGHRFPNISNTFCGIGFKNFAVTPKGIVTSCFEVLDSEDNRSKKFFIGRYVKGKGYELNSQNITSLKDLSIKVFPHCRDCFAKFHCAGDCRAKGLFLNDELHFNGGGRCSIIMELTKAKLIEQLETNEGDIYGNRPRWKKLQTQTEQGCGRGYTESISPC